MKFNFKIQQYQTDAARSIVEVFKGQPYSDPVNYRRDIGKVVKQNAYSQMSFITDSYEQMEFDNMDETDDSGFKNELVALSDANLFTNIKMVQ